ncbi:hypothetical protein THAOC_33457 [Thalassiosira oceanica]|uniref:Uncharacterized protein n=1 Tax=Thalassiosira oceanica TaxID=159749 RepID=K0R453_THAOC|nr:hypothetical protein THAOC_33457 [Thalassiosira oceanica]|eukprot:EJK47803.1 hypothetical protein THAOC_33457 [Thalassiosira oceanica]
MERQRIARSGIAGFGNRRFSNGYLRPAESQVNYKYVQMDVEALNDGLSPNIHRSMAVASHGLLSSVDSIVVGLLAGWAVRMRTDLRLRTATALVTAVMCESLTCCQVVLASCRSDMLSGYLGLVEVDLHHCHGSDVKSNGHKSALSQQICPCFFRLAPSTAIVSRACSASGTLDHDAARFVSCLVHPSAKPVVSLDISAGKWQSIFVATFVVWRELAELDSIDSRTSCTAGFRPMSASDVGEGWRWEGRCRTMVLSQTSDRSSLKTTAQQASKCQFRVACFSYCSREGPEAERSRSLAWRFRGNEPPPPHRPTSMDRVAPESPNEKPPVAVGAVRCVGAAVPSTGLNERVGEREGRLVSFFFASIKPGVVCWPTGRTQSRGCGWTSGAEQKSGLPEAMHQSWVSYRAVRLRPQT